MHGPVRVFCPCLFPLVSRHGFDFVGGFVCSDFQVLQLERVHCLYDMTEAKLKQLEKQLSKVTLQRDELQRDVETLCMQGSGNSIFDSSSVLSERIYSNEQEISKTRSQLEAVTEERDNLREDLRGYRDSKRQSDNGWRAEKQKVQALEKELSFYQTHSTKAFADRDKAVLEAEQLKTDNISLQRRLAKAESSAAQNTAICQETQTQLNSAQQRVAELEIKETECQAIPGLRQDLSEATEQIADLTVRPCIRPQAHVVGAVQACPFHHCCLCNLCDAMLWYKRSCTSLLMLVCIAMRAFGVHHMHACLHAANKSSIFTNTDHRPLTKICSEVSTCNGCCSTT